MTEQQKPHKWQKEIVAWAGGAKVEARNQTAAWRNPWWFVDENPHWNNPDFEFRIHDPYREFKDAEDQGQVVEFRAPNGTWLRKVNKDGWFFIYPPDHYRIAKPEPKPALSAHQANEWADAATNGLQWLLNIRDGVSTVDDAIEELMRDISRCRNVQPEPKFASLL